MELGTVGIWSGPLRRGDPAEVAEAADELDELGFGALWFPGERVVTSSATPDDSSRPPDEPSLPPGS